MVGGYCTKPSPGWYAKVDKETGEVGDKVREKETLKEEFWLPIFESTDFKEYLKQAYQIGGNAVVELEDVGE